MISAQDRAAVWAQRKAEMEARADQIIAEIMVFAPRSGRPAKRIWCQWCGNDLPLGSSRRACKSECYVALRADKRARKMAGELV